MKAVFSAIILLSTIGITGGCSSTARREAAMVGVASVTNSDAKWTPYAEYLQRALARVQRQWESAMIESRLPLPPVGTVVTVVFWVSSDGRVSRIGEVKTESEGSGGKFCVAAITRNRTFDPWTEEMKRRLGTEDRMTFTFHFEDPPIKREEQKGEEQKGSGFNF